MMLSNHSGLTKFLKANPSIADKVVLLSTDRIGFTADVGSKKGERFDFPFHSGAFEEILHGTEHALAQLDN